MLSLLNAEEMQRILLEVPGLIRRYERRDSDFVSGVKDWLDRMEKILVGNGMAVGVDIALLRGRLISTERGLVPEEITFRNRATTRKVRAAMAVEALQKATRAVTETIAPSVARFVEAEKLAKQIAAQAQRRGLLDRAAQVAPNTERMRAAWQALSDDPELRSWASLLEGSVGLRDALVLLDRTWFVDDRPG